MTPRRPVLLGVDPGEKLHALVALTPIPGGRFSVLKASMIPGDETTIRVVLEYATRQLGDVLVLGVERAEGTVYDRFRGASLLVSQDAGGEIATWGRSLGLTVVRASASRVRMGDPEDPRVPAVVGKLKPLRKGQTREKLTMDERVRRAVLAMVVGAESFGAGSHLFDAAAIAIWAAWQTTGGARRSA